MEDEKILTYGNAAYFATGVKTPVVFFCSHRLIKKYKYKFFNYVIIYSPSL